MFNIANQNFTLEAWAAPAAGADAQTVIARGGNARGAGLFVNADGTAVFAIRVSSAKVYLLDSDVPVTDGWHHLTGVFDAPTMHIYVDGQLRGSRAGGSIPNDPQEPTHIGADQEGSVLTGECCDGYDFFSGSIDEVRFYDAALNDEQVLSSYQSGAASH